MFFIFSKDDCSIRWHERSPYDTRGHSNDSLFPRLLRPKVNAQLFNSRVPQLLDWIFHYNVGLTHGIGMWDWNTGLECGTGMWNWNLGLDWNMGLECGIGQDWLCLHLDYPFSHFTLLSIIPEACKVQRSLDF